MLTRIRNSFQKDSSSSSSTTSPRPSVSSPQNVRKAAGIDQDTGEMFGLPASWLAVLNSSGIDQAELQENEDVILNCLKFQQGYSQGNLAQDAPPSSSSSTAAASSASSSGGSSSFSSAPVSSGFASAPRRGGVQRPVGARAAAMTVRGEQKRPPPPQLGRIDSGSPQRPPRPAPVPGKAPPVPSAEKPAVRARRAPGQGLGFSRADAAEANGAVSGAAAIDPSGRTPVSSLPAPSSLPPAPPVPSGETGEEEEAAAAPAIPPKPAAPARPTLPKPHSVSEGMTAPSPAFASSSAGFSTPSTPPTPEADEEDEEEPGTAAAVAAFPARPVAPCQKKRPPKKPASGIPQRASVTLSQPLATDGSGVPKFTIQRKRQKDGRMGVASPPTSPPVSPPTSPRDEVASPRAFAAPSHAAPTSPERARVVSPRPAALAGGEEARGSIEGVPSPSPPGDTEGDVGTAKLAAKQAKMPNLTQVVSLEDPRKRYKDLKAVGQGASGVVYSAIDSFRKTKVAVKEMRLKAEVNDKETLVSEIQYMKLCKHPNVIEYIESYLVGSSLWVVMEFVKGCDLSYITQFCNHKLTEPVIAKILHDILSAIEYMHSIGLVHRDIKSENVMVGGNGDIKIMDFGFGARLTQDQSKRMTKIGTPLWMAPEVIQQQPYGFKVDVWSLGVVTLELLDGLPPYADLPPLKALFKICSRGLPPPQRENVSAELLDFYSCCTKVNPAERSSASELLSHPFLATRANKKAVQKLVKEQKKATKEASKSEW